MTSVRILVLACNLVRLYIAIKTVPDWKTSVTVLKSIHEHGRKHHTEQCWCHNTALFDPIRYLKWFRELSIILHMCLSAIMKLTHHCYESFSLACVFRNKMTCAMKSDYSEEEVRSVNLTHSSLPNCAQRQDPVQDVWSLVWM